MGETTDKIGDFLSKLPRSIKGFGGNCGVFANALCRVLADQGKATRLVFVWEDEDGEYDESDLYHVAVEADGVFYDRSGRIGDAEAFEVYAKGFSEETYGDPDPYVHLAAYSAERARMARTNTAYTKSEDRLYQSMSRHAARLLTQPN